jgi:phosphotriesterase-related protein
MKNKIRTVTGWINPEQLNKTYGHEHLYTTATEKVVAENEKMALTDVDKIAVDLHLFKELGGNCIVEVTTMDYGRDVSKLKELSEMTGVYIVASGGFNKGTYNRSYLENEEISSVAEMLIREIREGVGDTGISPGILKIGTSQDIIHPWELVGLKAVSLAHKATGIPLTTHTQGGSMAKEQLDEFEAMGVDLSKVLIGHMDQLDDFDLHERCIKRGAYLGYDSLPKKKYDTQKRAIDFICRLAQQDLHTHILISGDYARQDYFKGYGGTLGLDYILTTFEKNFLDECSVRGLDGEKILLDLLVENPRRLLTFKEDENGH